MDGYMYVRLYGWVGGHSKDGYIKSIYLSIESCRLAVVYIYKDRFHSKTSRWDAKPIMLCCLCMISSSLLFIRECSLDKPRYPSENA